MQRRTFLEFTVTGSTLYNVPVRRRMLVDAQQIVSLDDLGESPDGARC